jgi:hypothetical protein
VEGYSLGIRNIPFRKKVLRNIGVIEEDLGRVSACPRLFVVVD